ncbi:MAG: hypothetical protein ACXADY_01070 [Candidatus Hodarchaeales archaeon]|jgi:hypothetical protein
MSINDLFTEFFSSFENIFIIILVILIILAYRVLNLRRPEEIQPVMYHFEKAETEYKEPSRPHSKTFNDFLQLASSVHERRHEILTQTLSQLINDYINFKNYNGNLVFSENLNLFISDPKGWYRHQSTPITRSREFRKKKSSDIFHTHLIEILEELQQHLDIILLPKME